MQIETRIHMGIALALALALSLAANAEQPSDAAQALEPEAAAAPAPAGEVARATFTSGVLQREPLDELREITEGSADLAYFTELKGMDGRTVIHRWEYEGQVMGEVAFDIGGPRWRVHSTKQIDPSQKGAWTVKVLDSQGNLLSEDHIVYASELAAREEPVPAPPAAPAAPAE